MRCRLRFRGSRALPVTAAVALLIALPLAPAFGSPLPDPPPDSTFAASDPRGPGPAGTNIAGGEAVAMADAPFAVQVAYDAEGTRVGCTGSQISAVWVITARHCDSARLQAVRLGTPYLGVGGSVRTVEARYPSPAGDVLLLKLSTPHPGQYATLSRTFPAPGSAARVFGWGDQAEGSGAMSFQLKTAGVTVAGQGSDAFGGLSVRTQSRTGHPLSGDSGGPLIVAGRLVGVLSTSSILPGGNTSGFAGLYNDHAAVSRHLGWIAVVTGVSPS